LNLTLEISEQATRQFSRAYEKSEAPAQDAICRQFLWGCHEQL